ncbi:collagenase-like [Eurosta solidaginis]|uniref:collagenase-like n=1 Tax=Eurosta solidaginis TaxID=178769 RepID=UPI003530C15C
MKSIVALSGLLCFASAFQIREIINTQGNILEFAEPNIVPSLRLLNSKRAAVNQFPYQAGLSLYDGGKMRWWCGGSLISTEWILTAAHCMTDALSVNVILGSTTRSNAPVSFDVDSSNFILHTEFNADTVYHDIALIRIPAVNYTKAIQPVRLPARASSYPTYKGKIVVMSGWGRTAANATAGSQTLRYGNSKVIPNEVCARRYSSSSIKAGKICTSTVNRIGICGGDSGGPLVLANSKLQIGIISFYSHRGCGTDAPAAHTRVTSYLHWIRANTGLKLKKKKFSWV